jgi:hypothetical protein
VRLTRAARGIPRITALSAPNGTLRDDPEAPPARRVPGKIDPGIRQAVLRLQQHNIETFQSCEGGPGHASLEPIVQFSGTPEAGWRAVAVCLGYGLPIRSLRRVWDVLDVNEPTGPYWEIVFSKRMI